MTADLATLIAKAEARGRLRGLAEAAAYAEERCALRRKQVQEGSTEYRKRNLAFVVEAAVIRDHLQRMAKGSAPLHEFRPLTSKDVEDIRARRARSPLAAAYAQVKDPVSSDAEGWDDVHAASAPHEWDEPEWQK